MCDCGPSGVGSRSHPRAASLGAAHFCPEQGHQWRTELVVWEVGGLKLILHQGEKKFGFEESNLTAASTSTTVGSPKSCHRVLNVCGGGGLCAEMQDRMDS